MRPNVLLLCAGSLGLGTLLGLGGVNAIAGDPPAVAPRAAAIGEAVTAFETTDVYGRAFALATARVISEPDALAATLAAAKEFDGAAATASTLLDELPGVRLEGHPDAARRTALVQAAYRPFGLVASAATTRGLLTIDDVVKKIVASAKAPIVFFAWSSACPTIELYAERFVGWFAETGARVFPFATNSDETAEEIRAAVLARKIPYRILLDPDARIAALLGARTTPHSFLLDEQNILRFQGAPDSDPAEMKDAAKRISYLFDALVAVADGRSVEIRMTNPTGCRIRRKP